MAHNYLLFSSSSLSQMKIVKLPLCIIIKKLFLACCILRLCFLNSTKSIKLRKTKIPFAFFELLFNEFQLISSQVFLIIFNPFLILFYGYQKNVFLYSLSLSRFAVFTIFFHSRHFFSLRMKIK